GGLATGDDTTVTIRIYSGSSVAGSALQTLSSVNVNQVTGAYSANATTVPTGDHQSLTSHAGSPVNTGTCTGRSFRVDPTAPTVTLDRPPTPTIFPSTTLFRSGGLATGDDTTVTIRIYSGSSVAGSALQTLSSVNVNQVTGAYSANATTLPDGTYTAQTSQDRTSVVSGTSAALSCRRSTTGRTVTRAHPTTPT